MAIGLASYLEDNIGLSFGLSGNINIYGVESTWCFERLSDATAGMECSYFCYLKSSYYNYGTPGSLLFGGCKHINVTPGEKGLLRAWGVGMGDRHRQDFSVIACPSTLDSGIPSNLWGLTHRKK